MHYPETPETASKYALPALKRMKEEGIAANPRNFTIWYEYFAGKMIAMVAPLADDGIEYSDGTKATVKQQAEDVTAFLAWAAEPELEERKRMGVKVILFLLLLTGLLYVVKRRIWANVH